MREGVLTQDADGTPRINGRVVFYNFTTGRWVYTELPKPPEVTYQAPEPTAVERMLYWLRAEENKYLERDRYSRLSDIQFGALGATQKAKAQLIAELNTEPTKKPSEPTPLEWLHEWLKARIGTTLNEQGNFYSDYGQGKLDTLKSMLDRVKALQ